ncbi:uncharacterized protein LOC109273967 [Panthera pardus]|uniref:Uncharacterized protein LOC109273967 n=1 Tax=Panthera pardus TaxID=9691 RepID=A0A9W2V8L1_PANPR|nr:uncharacterized protein LOC109273967 [Panthera pardus]XP_053755068.1 uncharacterized protein LOC109273967 [Panthera pardus]
MGWLVALILRCSHCVTPCPESPGLRVLLLDTGWGVPLSWDWEGDCSPGQDAHPGDGRLRDTGRWRKLRACPDSHTPGCWAWAPDWAGALGVEGRGGHCFLLWGAALRQTRRTGLSTPVAAPEAWRPRNAPHCTDWHSRAVAHTQSGRGVGAGWGGEGGPGCRWAAPPGPSRGPPPAPRAETSFSQAVVPQQEARQLGSGQGARVQSPGWGLGLACEVVSVVPGHRRVAGASASLCSSGMGLSWQSCVSDEAESAWGSGLWPMVRVSREPGQESALGGPRKVGAELRNQSSERLCLVQSRHPVIPGLSGPTSVPQWFCLLLGGGGCPCMHGRHPGLSRLGPGKR